MTPHNPLPPLEAMSEEELKELIALADKQIGIRETEKHEAFNKKVKVVKDAIWELLKEYPETLVSLSNGSYNDTIALDDLLDDDAIWFYQ